jgi:hypothetical protein
MHKVALHQHNSKAQREQQKKELENSAPLHAHFEQDSMLPRK